MRGGWRGGGGTTGTRPAGGVGGAMKGLWGLGHSGGFGGEGVRKRGGGQRRVTTQGLEHAPRLGGYLGNPEGVHLPPPPMYVANIIPKKGPGGASHFEENILENGKRSHLLDRQIFLGCPLVGGMDNGPQTKPETKKKIREASSVNTLHVLETPIHNVEGGGNQHKNISQNIF